MGWNAGSMHIGGIQRLSKKNNFKYTAASEINYPTAVEPSLVGEYPALVKSGAGYFYDELLEYRVWIDTEDGGEDLYNGDDYYYAFPTYEDAFEFSNNTKGAEQPLALVRQLESINEPDPGVFEHITETRITEWQPIWLMDNKRTETSIMNFLKEHN